MRMLAALTTCASLMGAGCATHIKNLCHGISPSSTFVSLESTPPGAIAKFPDGRTVTTPTRIVLRSDRDVTLTFLKDGYKPAEVEVGPGFNYWYLGNLLAIPPFGFFIDLEQSAVSRSYPSTVHVELESLALRDKDPAEPDNAEPHNN